MGRGWSEGVRGIEGEGVFSQGVAEGPINGAECLLWEGKQQRALWLG